MRLYQHARRLIVALAVWYLILAMLLVVVIANMEAV